MKRLINKLKEIFSHVKSNFFLKKYTPSESTMKLLRDLYPQVDWKRVDFYEGLPWFTPMVAPYVTAQALPKFYSLSRFCIYLKKFDESRAQCISDIVHEAFHVMQAMNFWNGYGFGFFRGWLIYYIAVFAKQGYRTNPFEVPAYDQEFRFLNYCQKHGVHGIVPKVPHNAFINICDEHTLVFKEYKYRYEGPWLLLAGSFLFCLITAVLKPVVDLLVFIIGSVTGKKPVRLA
jgi:hypothetical protein